MGSDFLLNGNEGLDVRNEYGSQAGNTANSFPTPTVIYTATIATVTVVLNP